MTHNPWVDQAKRQAYREQFKLTNLKIFLLHATEKRDGERVETLTKRIKQSERLLGEAQALIRSEFARRKDSVILSSARSQTRENKTRRMWDSDRYPEMAGLPLDEREPIGEGQSERAQDGQKINDTYKK